MANRILNSLSRRLGQYFDIGQREKIIDVEYHETEHEGHHESEHEGHHETEHAEPSYLSLKEQWTQNIISGDMQILEAFLKMKNPGKKERLIYLFRDNTELARWLIAQNNNDLYLKLPIEIWEIVDQLVK